MLRAGVPAAVAFMAIGIEVVVAYPVVILFGGGLAWRFAPEWWTHAGPGLRAALIGGWPWALGVVILTVGIGIGVSRWKRLSLREPGRGVARARHSWRDMEHWPVLAGLPTSFVNVAARSLMLPVLALTLPAHPPFGVMLVGSFVLLYSQLVLPTPAGAGAVDLAFLGGVAGDLGPGDAGLLLAWRFYTVGGGILLGAALAGHSFGLRPLAASVRAVLRRRAGAPR